MLRFLPVVEQMKLKPFGLLHFSVKQIANVNIIERCGHACPNCDELVPKFLRLIVTHPTQVCKASYRVDFDHVLIGRYVGIDEE